MPGGLPGDVEGLAAAESADHLVGGAAERPELSFFWGVGFLGVKKCNFLVSFSMFFGFLVSVWLVLRRGDVCS